MACQADALFVGRQRRVNNRAPMLRYPDYSVKSLHGLELVRLKLLGQVNQSLLSLMQPADGKPGGAVAEQMFPIVIQVDTVVSNQAVSALQ